MYNKFKIVFCVCLAFLTVLLLSGCVERFLGEETDYSSGEVLTPEMIESIFEAISMPATEKYPSETAEDGSLMLYWLENGSVWHISLNCGSISKAEPQNLRSGDIAAALRAGKERGCKICAKDFELEAESISATDTTAVSTEVTTQERYTKEYDTNGNLIVYWVKNGSVWHVSSKCSSLSKSSADNVMNGTEAEAQASGKERACKICSDEN